MLLFGCSKRKEAGTEGEFIDYTSLRADVVKRVQSGEIKPDEAGVVVLPQKLNMASVDGRAYVSKSPTSGQLIAFKSMAGKIFGEGILYAEKGISKDTTDIQVGPFTLAIRGRINEHWYRVGR